MLDYWQNKVLSPDKHVVLVLQSRLVFVSLDNPQNAEIFTNLGYGEKIGIKIQTTLTKISCSFSFDNFTTGYESVSMFVGMQRRLQCFTVDRDLLFVESDKHMISAWQGNTKSLRFMHRRNGYLLKIFIWSIFI